MFGLLTGCVLYLHIRTTFVCNIRKLQVLSLSGGTNKNGGYQMARVAGSPEVSKKHTPRLRMGSVFNFQKQGAGI